MNIKLYTTSSPAIKVNKALSLVADITGEPHDNVSDMEMRVRFTIEKLPNVKSANYCYIGDTAKYYFLVNYEIENHSVIAYLKEDVLMSYKSQLLAQTCTISKNEKYSNSYLYDDGYQLLAYKNIVTKAFPSGLTNNSIILMTVG